MSTAPKLDWRTIAPTTLSADLRKLYDAYKAAYNPATEERKAFEAAFIRAASPPAGKSVKFGFKYGKLAVALADGTAEKAGKADEVPDWAQAATSQSTRRR